MRQIKGCPLGADRAKVKPTADCEWKKKMWCIYFIQIHTHTYTHTVECYSAIKKNKILPFAATWMDLKTIMLSEVSLRKTNIMISPM